MANIISLNIVKRTVGGSAVLQNLPFGRKNEVVYSPAVIRGFDTKDIISSIRNDGVNSYFTTRELKGMDNESRKDEQITWFCSDSLATIVALSPDLVELTAVKRLEFLTSINDDTEGVAMNNEAMILNVNKMMTGAALVPRTSPAIGTIFGYIEEGNPNPVRYVVNETIAQIAASIGHFPIFVDKEVPAGTKNNINLIFTLAATPTLGSENVYLNGQVQTGGGVDYTIAGAVITFVIAPAATDILLVSYRK